MGKNRDRISIIAAILEASALGASKTRIMFSANLSFSLLEKYLSIALGSGFVQVEGYKYQLTEKGKEFLKQYRLFADRFVKAQQLLDNLGSERERLSETVSQSDLFSSYNDDHPIV